MKQAVLILAHKNDDGLKRILNAFDESFYFFIVIDKASPLAKADLSFLSTNANVLMVDRSCKMNWGSFLIIEAILKAVKNILDYSDFQYVHLISGQDYPIKSNDKIREFFFYTNGKEFMEIYSIPYKNWSGGGENRVNYYYLFDVLKARTGILRRLNNLFVDIQKKIKVNRRFKPDNIKLYGGSMWWSLSRECLHYVTDYVEENPTILKSFKHSFCSDEMFFPTIIMNSVFADRVINNNYRFICWEHRNGNYPANLDETDYNAIITSDKLFARKFQYPVSERLRVKLEQYIASSSDETKC